MNVAVAARIQRRSRRGHFSITQTVTVPSAASALQLAPRFRVLLVEDDPAFLRFLRESLQGLSAELEMSVVTRLSAAIACLKTQTFDAVLLDLNLPDSSGLSTLQQITAIDGSVPIVVLTGTDDARQAQDALRLGAQDWLTKAQPDPELVLRALRYAAERKRLTEGLIRSQKLEAVGLLARNVAHEFNNLLTTIIGNADLAASGNNALLRQRALAEIEQAASRGALLTRQLLGFARPRAAAPAIAEVTQAIVAVRDLCAAVLPRNIAICLDVHEPAWVPLAQEQLEQVLLNLVLNARDAMPRGGKITIAARHIDAAVAADPSHSGATTASARAWVGIDVQDSGTGIRPEVLPHVFEPFFTTKGDAGTGLGLMIVKELIEQAGGTIRAESQYGEETTFRVQLPQREPPE
jgi:two-component system, cell cycle sensor histidine kinase and response regulator CckA